MAQNSPTSSPQGGVDKQTQEPNWLEGFRFQFQALADSEFQRDTNNGINNCPKSIKKIGDNLIVIRGSGVNTIYDQNGKIVATVPPIKPGGKVFMPPEYEHYMKAMVRVIDQDAQEENWNRSSKKLSLSKYARNSMIGNIDIDRFIKILEEAGFDQDLLTGKPTAETLTMVFNNAFIDTCRFIDSSKIPNFEDYLQAIERSNKSYFFHSAAVAAMGYSSPQYMSDYLHYTFDYAAISIGYNRTENKMFAVDYKKPAAESIETRELKLEKLDNLRGVTGIGLDHGQNFLFVGMGHAVLVYEFHQKDTSKPLKLLHKFEDPSINFEGQILGQADGSVLVGDKEGRLRKIQTNLHTLDNYPERERKEKESARLAALTVVRAGNGKKVQAGAPVVDVEQLPQHLKSTGERFLREIKPDIDAASTIEELRAVQKTIDRTKAETMVVIKNQKTVNQIFEPLMEIFRAKEIEIWRYYFTKRISHYSGLRPRLKSFTAAQLSGVSKDIETDRRHMSVYKRAVPTNGMQVIDEIQGEVQDVLQGSEAALIQHIEAQFAALKGKVDAITKRKDFEEWLELDYPVFLEVMRTQQSIAPAGHTNFLKRHSEIMTEVSKLKRAKKREFDQQYDESRKIAAKKIETMVTFANDRISEFIEQFTEKVNRRDFADADTAKRWIDQSKAYETAVKAIEALDADAKDQADSLRQKLKSEVATLIYTVRRQKDTVIDATSGAQMTMFGKTAFPIWEGELEKETEVETDKKRKVSIQLIPKVDERTIGPGMSSDEYKCELYFKITYPDGKVEEQPFAGDEVKRFGYDDDRYFDVDAKGSYFPSYMTLREAKKIISAAKVMERSGDNDLKQKYQEFQTKISTLNKWIREQNKPIAELPEAVQQQRATLTKEYITFMHESGLYGWRKLINRKASIEATLKEKIQDAPKVKAQGRVPEWDPGWIMDEDVEAVLEDLSDKMLISRNKKGEYQGLLTLEGHAGTGKDVIVDMFCNKTRRPKFTFDCSKWTTEFDLSQDVSLAAEDGASYTIKEDSIIVKAIQTPGAVIYFNEFNAMPQTAQMFLHSLFDGKRQITLKVSGSRVVTAHPTVIAIGSMNVGPGYVGTNMPQEATRSRMRPTRVNYPEFARKDSTGKILSYSGSEALRAARSVRSLQDFTYDPNMKDNEFMQLWDTYINKGQNDPRLTPEIKYDIEVLFHLIYFGNQIREAYINKKRGAGKGVLTVSQPFTLREIITCASALGRMDTKEKLNIDTAEETARKFIRRFYCPLLDIQPTAIKEIEELEKSLQRWSAKKP